MIAANQRITSLASDRTVHRAFSWLHLHEAQLRRWQLEFLRIPAPPFAEAERAAWFHARFAELGLSNVHLDAEGNTLGEIPAEIPASINSNSSVILSEASPSHREAQSKDPDAARPTPAAEPFSTSTPHPEPSTLNPRPSSPIILLSAHLDTVFPAGTPCIPREENRKENRKEDREDDNRIRCPGACDNGAGLTALLGLAAALRASQIVPACTVLFAANVGEEGEGDLRGMRHLFTAPPYAGRIRAAIALEGAGTATVVDHALGSRRLRIEITGPGGHSWADAGMPSAIVALANGIAALSSLTLPSAPRTTLNCGTISGGTSVNSIPAHATADLDLRSTSMRELDRLERSVLAELSATVKAEAQRGHAEGSLRIQIRRIGNRAAGELPASSPLGRSLRAVDRHLGLQTESRVGSTDANLPLSLGIPALAIGAGGTGGGVHTTGEWYSPAGRELALRRALLLLLDLCRLAATDELVDSSA